MAGWLAGRPVQTLRRIHSKLIENQISNALDIIGEPAPTFLRGLTSGGALSQVDYQDPGHHFCNIIGPFE